MAKSSATRNKDDMVFEPLTSRRWSDFVTLFSEHGVQNGCWCMYWRVPRNDFQKNYGEGNKGSLKHIIDSGRVPGILAYYQGKPVGWCSVAPREDFPVVLRSRTLKPVDDLPVWSITCFFISKAHRKSGLTHRLIQAAIHYAKSKGARVIEAYPIDVDAPSIDYERYTGLTTTFEKEGFRQHLRRSERRPVMRYYISQ